MNSLVENSKDFYSEQSVVSGESQAVTCENSSQQIVLDRVHSIVRATDRSKTLKTSARSRLNSRWSLSCRVCGGSICIDWSDIETEAFVTGDVRRVTVCRCQLSSDDRAIDRANLNEDVMSKAVDDGVEEIPVFNMTYFMGIDL